MKLKKIIGMLIASFILIAAISVIYPNETYAANGSYVLGITNIRESGYGYGVGGLKGSVPNMTPNKKVWKIVSYNNNVISYDNAFYCLKAEHGFVNDTNNSSTDVSTIRKTYNTRFDMKQDATSVIARLNDINTAVGDAAITEANYNKILWIIDNMYLPKAGSKDIDKQTLAKAAGIPDGTLRLTDDELEAIQQLAIWHYTNPNASYYNTATTLYKTRVASQDNNYASLADIYDNPVDNTYLGTLYQTQANKIYNYLVDESAKHPSYLSEDVNKVPVTFTSNGAQANIENDRIVIGPFKITVEQSRAYHISEGPVFKDQSGNTINLTGDNKLLDSSKDIVSSGNINDVIGQNFFISLPKNTNIRNVAFSLKGTYPTTTATYYTTSASTATGDQPVVLVERGNREFKGEFSVPIVPPEEEEKPKVDLALRKFITSINSMGVEKR